MPSDTRTFRERPRCPHVIPIEKGDPLPLGHIQTGISRCCNASIALVNHPKTIVLLRNLIFPIAAVYLSFICGIKGNILLTVAVLSACPTAGMSVLFAALTDKDTVFPSKIMMLSTLLSLVTVPVVIMFGKVLLG